MNFLYRRQSGSNPDGQRRSVPRSRLPSSDWLLTAGVFIGTYPHPKLSLTQATEQVPKICPKAALLIVQNLRKGFGVRTGSLSSAFTTPIKA